MRITHHSFSVGAAFLALGIIAIPAQVVAQTLTFGPDVPHDIERKAPSDEYNTELAVWAWQQFVALGWKATYDAGSLNFQRGTADTSWNLSDGTPDTVVWETFAHRSELRPWGVPLTASFDSKPDYLTEVRANGMLSQGMDQNGNPASFTLLNNLDEDNEIGSADIYVGAVTAPTTTSLILYQAKTNRDEYDYIKNIFGAGQADPKGALAVAAANNLANIKAHKAYFLDQNGQPVYNICQTPTGVAADSSITLPCGVTGGQEGAIEIKTAFMLIPDGQEAAYADYLVREAIYYTQGLNADGTGNGEFTYHNGSFALLGIHIIHKTTNFPALIFTSFQHKDLENQDLNYVLLSSPPPLYGDFNIHGAVVEPANAGGGTQFGGMVKIVRQDGPDPVSGGDLYPVPTTIQQINAEAQESLSSSGSIWANYALIGVQALQTNSYAPSPTTNAGPNHYMANFVIESDGFLGNFFGPGFTSTDAVFPTGPKFSDGSQNGGNGIYMGDTFNVGGCKGCHGVAATGFGTDSSFLLDFGAGKPVAEPDTIFYVRPKLVACLQPNLQGQSGSLQFFEGVTCKQAQEVAKQSPPCGGQNYEPYTVANGLGTWGTQDQCSGQQQPYSSADSSKSFEWYACARYPQDCE